MTEKLFLNSKSSNQNVLKIYNYVYKNKESETWESKENIQLFTRIFSKISDNRKRLCEGGAKKFKTFYKFFPEQKPFSFFQNYKKIKNEMVFCD